MALTVSYEMSYEFTVQADAGEVFSVLSDVPTSVSHFPKVARLVDLGGNAYRWEMEKIGPGHMGLATVYACQYTSNKRQCTVVWTPIAGVGNAQVAGDWKIKKAKPGTHITLHIQGEQDTPMPRLMSAVVAPVVRAEFAKLVEGYVANLTRRFGGAA